MGAHESNLFSSSPDHGRLVSKNLEKVWQHYDKVRLVLKSCLGAALYWRVHVIIAGRLARVVLFCLTPLVLFGILLQNHDGSLSEAEFKVLVKDMLESMKKFVPEMCKSVTSIAGAYARLGR